MKIYEETSLENFSFWGGARQVADHFTTEDFETIELYLTDLFNDEPIEDTTINDFIWFDEDTWLCWLGYEGECAYDDFLEDRKNDERRI